MEPPRISGLLLELGVRRIFEPCPREADPVESITDEGPVAVPIAGYSLPVTCYLLLLPITPIRYSSSPARGGPSAELAGAELAELATVEVGGAIHSTGNAEVIIVVIIIMIIVVVVVIIVVIIIIVVILVVIIITCVPIEGVRTEAGSMVRLWLNAQGMFKYANECKVSWLNAM